MRLSSLSSAARNRVATALIFVSPACFCSNMILAKAMSGIFPPVAMALSRWSFVALLIGLAMAPVLAAYHQQIRREWKSVMLLGGLGMGLCGAPIYMAGTLTTATNIGLIYAVCPILILSLSLAGEKRRPGLLQSIGMGAGFIGVVFILMKGQLEQLLLLSVNSGDLLVVMGTVAFAVYSIGLKAFRSELPALLRFGVMAFAGSLWHFPFWIYEAVVLGDRVVLTPEIVGVVAILVLVASLGAYLSYGYIVERLGASRAGLVLYMLPLYNALFAVILLDEHIQLFHLIGGVLILGGMWLSGRSDRTAA